MFEITFKEPIITVALDLYSYIGFISWLKIRSGLNLIEEHQKNSSDKTYQLKGFQRANYTEISLFISGLSFIEVDYG